MSWDDDINETIDCPYCDAPVYEDAVQCSACGNYLSKEDAPSKVPPWIWITAVICIAMVLFWIISEV